MPNNNFVDEPMCPHCHTFLEYNYTGYHDVDEDTATFNERFFCPNCQREFWATSVYEFKGYKDIKELG